MPIGDRLHGYPSFTLGRSLTTKTSTTVYASVREAVLSVSVGLARRGHS
jgi:hypothetical protein